MAERSRGLTIARPLERSPQQTGARSNQHGDAGDRLRSKAERSKAWAATPERKRAGTVRDPAAREWHSRGGDRRATG
jgi:hypothetical protein